MLELLMLINAERAKPLQLDPILTERAEQRAEILCKSGYFTHIGSNISFIGTQYLYNGENLAFMPTSSLKQAHRRLMKSETHKANIVSNSFTDVGLAKKKCRKGYLTVQLFGAKPKPHYYTPVSQMPPGS